MTAAHVEKLDRLPRRLQIVVEPGELEALEQRRPKTRRDCECVPRPCPYVGCRYNTYLEVLPSGNIKYLRPDVDPFEVPAATSCSLDVAERGGLTLDEVGDVIGVVRERIRQIEQDVYEKIARKPSMAPLRELLVEALTQKHAGTWEMAIDELADVWTPYDRDDQEKQLPDRVWLTYEREGREGAAERGEEWPRATTSTSEHWHPPPDESAWVDKVFEGLVAGKTLREAFEIAFENERK